MSLDGLRAWIGEVERKLGMRTRVFLVLTALAIGIGGAALYLAIDARENSVSESDVQELQKQLEARAGTGGEAAAGTGSTQLEAELKALQAEVAELKSNGGSSRQSDGKSSGTGGVGADGAGGGQAPEEAGAGTSGGATGGNPSAAKLGELLRQAKERSEEAE